MTNVSEARNPSSLLIAAADQGTHFGDLVSETLQAIGIDTKELSPVSMDDFTPDWDIVYPVGALLHSIKIPLPDSFASVVKWKSIFTVQAIESSLNSVKQTRRLTLQIDHPGIIWTVIAFTANVIEWDLPQKPPRGSQRHHIKVSN